MLAKNRNENNTENKTPATENHPDDREFLRGVSPENHEVMRKILRLARTAARDLNSLTPRGGR